MESTDSHKKKIPALHPLRAMASGAAIAAVMTAAVSCGQSQHRDEAGEQEAIQEEYHADNDIAMTIRSLADALRVGEELDSTEYDYEGVLTDGQGRPLYTDVQGAPGIWQVDVVDSRTAMVRNIYLGDLLPGALEEYLAKSLGLTLADRHEVEEEDVTSDNETSATEYVFDWGRMRVETRAGIAPNGLEGPLINIILTSKDF